jgi:hypothetical protein
MTENRRGLSVTLQVVWILVGLLVAAVAALHIVHGMAESKTKITFTTPYQAVLLTNGSVYFGHLQDYDSRHPVLTDVYYVVSQTNPQTKQTNNVLVKRGKELHEPDRMYLIPNQIVLVEPVGTASKVAQLIAQAKQ